ncbi:MULTISPECIES: hypothetical protein [Inquilinus]|uniref:Uncharacterized protein n=1 Tax=Inquilinus ginsengisoli TaxID=363840 RepID=A0ABU1JN43_9PROT|nr:hypothetical protein [Inquilinus ginsengisoli]MDR6290035.1 hypothetical protein [Inquilinus ginsengisoli]
MTANRRSSPGPATRRRPFATATSLVMRHVIASFAFGATAMHPELFYRVYGRPEHDDFVDDAPGNWRAESHFDESM